MTPVTLPPELEKMAEEYSKPFKKSRPFASMAKYAEIDFLAGVRAAMGYQAQKTKEIEKLAVRSQARECDLRDEIKAKDAEIARLKEETETYWRKNRNDNAPDDGRDE